MATALAVEQLRERTILCNSKVFHFTRPWSTVVPLGYCTYGRFPSHYSSRRKRRRESCGVALDALAPRARDLSFIHLLRQECWTTRLRLRLGLVQRACIARVLLLFEGHSGRRASQLAQHRSSLELTLALLPLVRRMRESAQLRMRTRWSCRLRSGFIHRRAIDRHSARLDRLDAIARSTAPPRGAEARLPPLAREADTMPAARVWARHRRAREPCEATKAVAFPRNARTCNSKNRKLVSPQSYTIPPYWYDYENQRRMTHPDSLRCIPADTPSVHRTFPRKEHHTRSALLLPQKA